MTTDKRAVRILFADEHVVAVDKPAGLLFHRTAIDREKDCLVQRLRDQIGQRVYPVHRLDRGTSGVAVFGLHAEATQALQASFADGRVAKTYLAIVRGFAPESVDIDWALQRIKDWGPKQMVGEPQEARTLVERLATAELPHAVGPYSTARYSLIECRPHTGRRHQIRRHLKHLRHPVIGDANYGDLRHNRFFRQTLGIEGLLLRAVHLRVPHPESGESIGLDAALDDRFERVLRELAIDWPTNRRRDCQPGGTTPGASRAPTSPATS